MERFNKFSKARKAVEALLGEENVLTDEVSLLLNSFDGSPVKTLPDAVLNITDAELLPALLKILYYYHVPFVPRAAATNHDGGAVALKGGCILNLSALNKIILIDTKNEFAEVECGVINQHLQDALAPLGYFYAPDPASAAYSTVGGNCALNAGGGKTLKYGASGANILAADFVTPLGDFLHLERNAAGPGMAALLTRGEGTLGIITKLRVKIKRSPADLKTVLAYFKTLQDTMETVRDIIAAGILPCALEAMDKTTMELTQTPCPEGTEAFLLIEIDGKKQELEPQLKTILDICSKNKAAEISSASDDVARQKLWARRKAAAASFVKAAPNLLSLDAALPRAQLPAAIDAIRGVFAKYKIRGGMVFHAGDGNVHPNIAFDETNLYESAQIKKAVKEIHEITLNAGGSLSGEHGIGVEKRAAMALMYSPQTLQLFKRVKNALDPAALANPDKIIPLSPSEQPRQNAPGYLADIVDKMKQAAGAKLTIAGQNTKLKTKNKNVLDISALDKITDIDKVNYTVTAQAAVSLKDLAKELQKHNMYLPVPVAKGTLGGVFAAKTFEDLEDFVTGLDFLLPDGTFISLGGKYVKNAAGYDLIRFLSGSSGAYGLITALTIRTFAAPPAAQKPKSFELFKPGIYETALKKVFDPANIFNSFIFEAALNEK